MITLLGNVRYLLDQCRLPHSTEAELQEAMTAALLGRGFYFEREYRLGPKDVVDFFVTGKPQLDGSVATGGVAIECKVKGQPLAIVRQLERYAKHDVVECIVLYTARHMQAPEHLNGKPVVTIKAGGAWL